MTITLVLKPEARKHLKFYYIKQKNRCATTTRGNC